MTAANQPRRTVLNGNDGTGPYSFSFGLIKVEDLTVELFPSTGGSSTLTQGVDYTVTTTTNADGFIVSGSITTTVNVVAADQLVISASSDFAQGTVYPENGTFPAKTNERDHDEAAFRDQELRDQILRSLLLPSNFEGSQLTFPAPVAGLFVRANAAGTGFELATLTGSGTIATPVSVADGGIGAGNRIDGRVNLGIPISSFESVNANETIAAADIGKLFLFDTSGGERTGSLPALASVENGYSVAIAKRTGANDVVIDPSGAEVIVGLNLQNGEYRISDIGGLVVLTKTTAGVWWAEAHTNMIGATALLAGREGRVPAPAAGQESLFLRGDGQWGTPPAQGFSSFTTFDATNGGANDLNELDIDVSSVVSGGAVTLEFYGRGLSSATNNLDFLSEIGTSAGILTTGYRISSSAGGGFTGVPDTDHTQMMGANLFDTNDDLDFFLKMTNVTSNVWYIEGWCQVDGNGELEEFYGTANGGANALETVRFDTTIAATFNGGNIYWRSR